MNNRGIARQNNYLANRDKVRGSSDDLGSYLFPTGEIGNFIISGGEPYQRFSLLVSALQGTLGALPVIVFHNSIIGVEQIFHAELSNAAQAGCSVHYAIVNDQNRAFEPFLGMSESAVNTCLRKMAQKLGFQISAEFDQTARAHFQILRLKGAPLCLSSLYYLATFTDMELFFKNVMALPCSRSEAQQIWAKLGASDSSTGQFELFRSIILNFAEEAGYSGWSKSSGFGSVNCYQALQNGACLSLPLDGQHSDLMDIYLAEELSMFKGPCFLLFCDTIIGPELVYYLRSSSGRIRFGFSAQHAAEMVPEPPDAFSSISEMLDSLIIFQHNSAIEAEKYSQIIGKYDESILEQSRGFSWARMELFSRGRTDGFSVRTQNVYRVRPEDITSLPPSAAYIYLPSQGGQIIYFKMGR